MDKGDKEEEEEVQEVEEVQVVREEDKAVNTKERVITKPGRRNLHGIRIQRPIIIKQMPGINN